MYYGDDYTGDKPPADLGAAAYLLAHDPETTFLGCLDPDPDKQEKDLFQKVLLLLILGESVQTLMDVK